MKTVAVARAAILAAGILLCASPALAVSVDGTLDPEYGPAYRTQTNQTASGDTPQSYFPADLTHAAGSELDGAYAVVSDGVLHLFLAGNLKGFFNVEFYPQDYLQVFIDSKSGGQNVLRADNPTVGFFGNALTELAGLTFDAGFAPDYWLNCNVWSVDPPLRAYWAELPEGGGGGGRYLGGATAGGPGALSGGTNPDGIEVSIDNLNTGGVTQGCDPASGAGVTTGIEWAIPLAAIGNPTGCISICAFTNCADYYAVNSQLSNQVLGPLPAGSCALGAPAGVNFASIAGDQFFTVCVGATPAHTTTWGSLKTLYR